MSQLEALKDRMYIMESGNLPAQKNNYTVTPFCQANELVYATSQLTGPCVKLFFFVLAKREESETMVKTTLTEIAKCMEGDAGGNRIRAYRQALKEIVTKSYVVVNMPVSRLPYWQQLGYKDDQMIEVIGSIIIGAQRDPVTGEVVIELKKEFLPLLDELHGNTTWALIEQVALLSGKYAPRLYVWLQMKLGTLPMFEDFIWYIDSQSGEQPGIRQYLGFTDKQYKNSGDLKRRVLDPAFQEINDCIDTLHVDVEYLHNGKTNRIYAVKMNITNPKKLREMKTVGIVGPKNRKAKKVRNEPLLELPETAGGGQSAAREIVDYMNTRLNRKFRQTSLLADMCDVLLARNYTVKDMKTAVENCIANWKGTKLDGNLRPQIILKEKNFDEYLNMGDGLPANYIRPYETQQPQAEILQEDPLYVKLDTYILSLSQELKRCPDLRPEDSRQYPYLMDLLKAHPELHEQAADLLQKNHLDIKI